jgi:putative ABC transport system permease protein
MDTLWRNLRFGLRLLAKSPGFTAVALITLALGIGVNAAIFSIVNVVLLHPLPYRDAGQLLSLSGTEVTTGNTGANISYTRFTLIQQQSRALDSIGVYSPLTLSLTTNGDPEAIPAVRASESLFHVLGVTPAMGRAFLPTEDKPGAPEVAVVSDAFWRNHLGGRPDAIGQSLSVDGHSATVIGILPADFQFPFLQRETGIWLTRPFDNPELGQDKVNSGAGYLFAIARAKEPTRVQPELDALTVRYKQQFPGYADAGRFTTTAVSLESSLLGSLRSSLLVLLGAVGFVLLIACANVASLLLARATTRRREVAVRMAIGASSRQIVEQVLTESVLLSFLGGALGVFLAARSLPLLMRLAVPATFPRSADVHIDSAVLLFSATLCCLTGIVFGIGPALQVTHTDLNESLKEGGRGSTAGSRGLRELVVIGEVALALMLMTGAGLFIKSFVNLMRVNPGFESAHVMTFPLTLPATKYPKPEERAQFYRELVEKVRHLPGVESASLANFLPLSGGGRYVFFCPEGHVCRGLGKDGTIANRMVSPNYFQTMHTPVLRGRIFTDADRAGAPRVALINETTALREFPNGDALGKHIANSRDMAFMEIVGIVADTKLTALNSQPAEEMYLPVAQNPPPGMTLLVRSASLSQPLVSAVRHAVRGIDPGLALTNISSMDEVVSLSVGQPHLLAQLVGGFAALALILASVGIYGLMAYFVTQRTLEIAVRMALGADRRIIYRLVISQGLKLVAAGIVLGLGASLVLTRVFVSQLFGTGSTDTAILIGSATLFLLVALAACYIPARRATNIDAIATLRCQ